MPDTVDDAQAYTDREMAAALAARRTPVAIVWRRDGRVKHTVSNTSRARAKMDLADEVEIDMDGPDWAIAYIGSDGGIECQGADDLAKVAQSELESHDRNS